MDKPEKLSESETFQTAKKEIMERIIPFKKWRPDGRVKYLDEDPNGIESLHFVIYLLKENTVCCLSFGEHRFPDNQLFQSARGGAGYTITFQPLRDYLIIVVRELNEVRDKLKHSKGT